MFKLISVSNIQLNLKYEGTYDKIKVAKKIALAVNQAKADGLNLNNNSWKSIWDSTNCKWKLSNSNNWCGLLGTVLLYSDCNFNGSKIEAVASLLGVEKEWLLGFSYALNGKYESVVKNVIKRKSKKGQHCIDGIEIGKLFKLAYLSDLFFEWHFIKTTKSAYETHQWEFLEESKVFLSLGINHSGNIKKCKQCNMYGGIVPEHVFTGGKNCYFINNNWDCKEYKYREFTELSCNEFIIKNLLS